MRVMYKGREWGIVNNSKWFISYVPHIIHHKYGLPQPLLRELETHGVRRVVLLLQRHDGTTKKLETTLDIMGRYGLRLEGRSHMQFGQGYSECYIMLEESWWGQTTLQ